MMKYVTLSSLFPVECRFAHIENNRYVYREPYPDIRLPVKPEFMNECGRNGKFKGEFSDVLYDKLSFRERSAEVSRKGLGEQGGSRANIRRKTEGGRKFLRIAENSPKNEHLVKVASIKKGKSYEIIPDIADEDMFISPGVRTYQRPEEVKTGNQALRISVLESRKIEQEVMSNLKSDEFGCKKIEIEVAEGSKKPDFYKSDENLLNSRGNDRSTEGSLHNSRYNERQFWSGMRDLSESKFSESLRGTNKSFSSFNKESKGSSKINSENSPYITDYQRIQNDFINSQGNNRKIPLKFSEESAGSEKNARKYLQAEDSERSSDSGAKFQYGAEVSFDNFRDSKRPSFKNFDQSYKGSLAFSDLQRSPLFTELNAADSVGSQSKSIILQTQKNESRKNSYVSGLNISKISKKNAKFFDTDSKKSNHSKQNLLNYSSTAEEYRGRPDEVRRLSNDSRLNESFSSASFTVAEKIKDNSSGELKNKSHSRLNDSNSSASFTVTQNTKKVKRRNSASSEIKNIPQSANKFSSKLNKTIKDEIIVSSENSAKFQEKREKARSNSKKPLDYLKEFECPKPISKTSLKKKSNSFSNQIFNTSYSQPKSTKVNLRNPDLKLNPSPLKKVYKPKSTVYKTSSKSPSKLQHMLSKTSDKKPATRSLSKQNLSKKSEDLEATNYQTKSFRKPENTMNKSYQADDFTESSKENSLDQSSEERSENISENEVSFANERTNQARRPLARSLSTPKSSSNYFKPTFVWRVKTMEKEPYTYKHKPSKRVVTKYA